MQPENLTLPAEPVPADITPPVVEGRSILAEWTVTILLLMFGMTTLVQAFVIPTGSMEDTLLIGDHLLVDKLTYAPPGVLSKYVLPYREVRRGDIIVFRYPADIRQTYVKRVVGVPGDTIRIENKQLYLNGKSLSEPYKYLKTGYFDPYRDNFPGDPNTHVEPGGIEMLRRHTRNGEVVVPPGRYFALGDNRDASTDSRFWGFVPRENIIGKPLIVYWSFQALPGELAKSGISWEHAKDLTRNFFIKTRWRRAFKIVRGHAID